MLAIKSENGFTLIEFLVSVVILMVGLLGLLQAVNMGIATNMGNKLRNEATVVADEALSARVAQLSTTDTVAFSLASSSSTVTRKVYAGSKSYAVKTKSLPISNSVEINVTVNWTHKGNTFSHNASTILSKR